MSEKMIKKLTAAIIIGFTLLAILTACGQSGALYLPAPAKETTNVSSQN
jgi:predicted small lipoprotein YifL